METSKNYTGLKGTLGVNPTEGERDQPEYLIMSKSMKWVLMFLSAIQQFVRKATTLQTEDLKAEPTPRMQVMKLLTESPIRVRLDKVMTATVREDKSALSITTEWYPSRELWLTFDELKRPGTEKWEQYLVLMYSENDYDWREPSPQEGILARYPIVGKEARTVEWMMSIAHDVIIKLYQAEKHTPLQE